MEELRESLRARACRGLIVRSIGPVRVVMRLNLVASLGPPYTPHADLKFVPLVDKEGQLTGFDRK
jgi:hypothetical protein